MGPILRYVYNRLQRLALSISITVIIDNGIFQMINRIMNLREFPITVISRGRILVLMHFCCKCLNVLILDV